MKSFIANFLGVKANDTVNAAIETLVRFDPKGASEAQILQMDQNLTQLSRSVAEARAIYEKEKKEADAAEKAQNERFQISEILVRRMDAETDEAKKAGIQRDFDAVLKDIEKFAPEVEREKHEAASAGDFLHDLEKAQAEAAERLKTARADLTAAQRDMQKAAMDRENTARLEAIAKQAAGIANASGSLDVALKAMRSTTEKDQIAAAASRDKARLLTPHQTMESDNIKSAMAELHGTPAASSLSPAERLAALKAQRDSAAA